MAFASVLMPSKNNHKCAFRKRSALEKKNKNVLSQKRRLLRGKTVDRHAVLLADRPQRLAALAEDLSEERALAVRHLCGRVSE
jgi:hypothetical protein